MIKEICGLFVHPVANIMPMMSVAELDALALDIESNGLREPIWLFRKDGYEYIVDGRNRSLACQRVGIVPEYRYYDGTEDSLLNFVISLNISRRHLSSGQKACLAVEILPMIEEQTKKNLSEKISIIRKGGTVEKSKPSTQLAGEVFGVSGSNIKSARKLHKESTELFGRVLAGELTLNKAMVELKTIEEKTNLPNPAVEPIEPVASVTPVEPAQSAPVASNSTDTLTPAESRKLSAMVANNINPEHATNYLLSIRKPKVIKAKTSFSNRIEFKVDESEKMELMELAKRNNMSLSEYIRSIIKKG